MSEITEIKTLNGHPLADTKARAGIATLTEENARLSGYFEGEQAVGKNLLNPDAVQLGKQLNNNNDFITDVARYMITDYIAVKPGQSIGMLQLGMSGETQKAPINFIAAYNSFKTIVPDAKASYVEVYVVPDGISYIRISTDRHSNTYADGSAVGAERLMICVYTEGMPFEPYDTVNIQTRLKAEYNNDDHIRAIARTVTPVADVYAWGLPVLELNGDTAGMTKDDAVTLNYVYGERSGTCTVKWQGSSSIKWAKKNYTVKFDNAFEAAEGWGEQNKYCLKANYIDFSHARNVVNAKLWGQIVKSRSTVPSELANLVNAGAVDGFPCIITLNGEFHGLYTFNIPKDGWIFGMGNGTNEAILCADDHVDATKFKAAATLDGDFELEYVTDENNTAWVTTSVNTLINACINSNGSDLDTTIAQYLDWQSAIDYFIFTVLVTGGDMTDKNYILATFDGTKWYFSAYDMDCTYGLSWDGNMWYGADYWPNFANYAGTHRVMQLICANKKAELKARYAELRAGVLSESNLATVFANFTGAISSGVFAQDVQKWPMIPNTSTNNISQIRDYYRMRVAYADKWMEQL